MPKRPTAIRIDPGDHEKIEKMAVSGKTKDVSNFVRDAIREKLDENRVSVVLDQKTMVELRYLIEIGVYDSTESFLHEAVQRHLYLSKDKETTREALFKMFLEDPTFREALREFIHTVFVEGFRPPLKQ